MSEEKVWIKKPILEKETEVIQLVNPRSYLIQTPQDIYNIYI